MKQLLFILSIFLAVGCTDKSEPVKTDLLSTVPQYVNKKHLLFYPNYLNRNNREKPAD